MPLNIKRVLIFEINDPFFVDRDLTIARLQSIIFILTSILTLRLLVHPILPEVTVLSLESCLYHLFSQKK